MNRSIVLVVLAALSACGGGDPTGTGGGGGGFGGGTGGGFGGGGGTAACSAANCLGCCFNGACQSGNTAAACGKGGLSCSACGTGQICTSAQTCGLDPQSTFKLLPVSATVSSANAPSGGWDVGGGAPDPFVLLWCPATAATSTARTPTANDVFTPTWSSTDVPCLMKAGDLMTIGFGVAVMDEDVTTDDVIAGQGTIKPTEADFSAGFISVGNGTTLTGLRVNLVRQ